MTGIIGGGVPEPECDPRVEACSVDDEPLQAPALVLPDATVEMTAVEAALLEDELDEAAGQEVIDEDDALEAELDDDDST
jgi:hypothetical protein